MLCCLATSACRGTAGRPIDEGSDEVESPATVVALGRIEPGEGVIDVGAPPGARVAQLEVQEGDRVAPGQLLARLESHATRLAEHQRLLAQVEEAEVQLRRARQLGPLEVQAQEAEVRRLDTELALAQSDLRRLETLLEEAVATEQDHEHQRTLTERARETLEHGRILLEKLRHQQQLAVAEAQARLATARGNLATGEALLEQTEIRSPVAGEVLKILTWPGERVAETVLQIGETGRMYAVAEVYETDVRLLAPGQPARVHSPAIGQVLHGSVERIGSMIYRNDVLSLDPTADRDTRVVEVRVRLEDGSLARKLNLLQVDVEIDTAAKGSER